MRFGDSILRRERFHLISILLLLLAAADDENRVDEQQHGAGRAQHDLIGRIDQSID